MNEYKEAMSQYEDKLSKAVQRVIELESLRAHLLKFKVDRLQVERERLLSLIKETQKKYIQLGMIETRIYNNKMRSFATRLSEVEEKIALREAQAAIRKGRRKLKKK